MGVDDAMDIGTGRMDRAVNGETGLVDMRLRRREHGAVERDAHQRRGGDLLEHGAEPVDEELLVRPGNARRYVGIDDVVHAM
jgi:hypothetical protein